MHFYIEQLDNKFLTYTINWIGILMSDYSSHTISFNSTNCNKFPYIKIKEGFISHMNTIDIINKTPNIDIIYNNTIILQKRVNDTIPVTTSSPTDVYFLYNNSDYIRFESIVLYWESQKDDHVYLINTESINNISLTTNHCNIAGLASGSFVAEFAHKYKSNKVVFFDYSRSSLDLQEELIHSSDRYATYEKYLPKLITGLHPATKNDIKQLNLTKINTIYDNLKSKQVSFVYCDMRKLDNIFQLFSQLDYSFSVWLSNLLYYVTSFNKNKTECIDLIYTLANDKKINLLPHMKLTYES